MLSPPIMGVRRHNLEDLMLRPQDIMEIKMYNYERYTRAQSCFCLLKQRCLNQGGSNRNNWDPYSKIIQLKFCYTYTHTLKLKYVLSNLRNASTDFYVAFPCRLIQFRHGHWGKVILFSNFSCYRSHPIFKMIVFVN